MSPTDSPVALLGSPVEHRFAGRKAYIGQESIDRHRDHLSLCLEYPEEFFLLHDADSFCLSPELPEVLYETARKGVLWTNEVVDPRPHETPYRKIAMQPPYFLTRHTLLKLLHAPVVPTHPITPFIDWWWTAHCWSAGVPSSPFSEMEHPPKVPWTGGDPWEWREHMIRNCGTIMQHPIKTEGHYNRMRLAYEHRAN